MYKRLVLILALIAVLTTLVGVAATPVVNVEARSVRLLKVGYYGEKGVVFKFQLTGDFKDKELKGSVFVDGKTVKVYCVRKARIGGAQCVAASITSRQAGKMGVITFAGFSFTFIVPARNTPR
jgi:hypothetical protein